MLRTAVAVAVVAAIFGCGPSRSATRSSGASAEAGGGMDPPAEAMTDTQLAAHAGNAKFPGGTPRDDWRVAAVVSRDRRTIKLYNFESTPLRAVNIWVNGAYVQPIQGVPAQSKAVVRTDKLFNGLGNTFASRSEEVSRVQLETRDGVYNVMGPATE